MGEFLPDGTILPQHLSARQAFGTEDVGQYNNDLLRVGEVQDVVWADDKRNPGGRTTVYSVQVQHYDRLRHTYVSRLYPRCVLANMFGSAADRLNFSLRTAAAGGGRSDTGLGKGAKVVLACINGEQANPVILGTVPDPADSSQTQDSRKKLGRNLDFLFNGLSAVVNDDGELVLTRNGPTKADGSQEGSNDSNAGAAVSMTKDGKINLAHKQGVKIGSGSDAMLLGKTFRDAQKQMNSTIQGYFNSMQGLLQTAATALTTAGGSMGTPIAGAVAAAPQITTAGTALIAAAKLAGQIAQALQDFEQSGEQSNSYLSENNTSD